MIKIIEQPYKVVYEGMYERMTFELEIFRNGSQEVNWMDFPKIEVKELEQEIYKHYRKHIE